jgi:putative hydrolase of the HAD superfamily
MQPEPRAVLFDLDDTLYPLRHFVRSGFVACAAHLEREMGLNPRNVLSILLGASIGPDRGRELQVCVARCGLTSAIVPALVEVIRQHPPQLSLPLASCEALAALRDGWLLGVVTNGPPDVQERKVRALGLPLVVDTIVFAAAVGDGRGKPQPEAFLEAAGRLGVIPERTVFVGNDLLCDVFGASRVGMRTVLVERPRGSRAPERLCNPDVTIASLCELAGLVESLVPQRWTADVA